MRNLKFLLFAIYLSFIFSGNLWEHEPTGWGYDQTTQQCFYMFQDMQIESLNDIQIIGVGDGTNIEQSLLDQDGDGVPDSECGLTDECDIVGAFIIHTQERDASGNLTGNPMTQEICQIIEGEVLWSDDGLWTVEGCELCIGINYFNSDSEDATTVVAMGISENSDTEKLHYYATSGDNVTFKFYDASLDTKFDLSISSDFSPDLYENGLDPWEYLGLFLYLPESLIFIVDIEIVYGCADSDACNYEGANEDDGSCIYPVDDCTSCDGADIGGQDCLGICGGDAVLDVCGECDGGIEDESLCSSEGDNDDFIVYGLEISNIYPNPFNPATNITYSIDHYSKVKIDIYSIDGKIVSNLVNSYQSHGLYTINWNPNITAGIYFVKMRVGLFSDTKKIIYIK